MGKAGAAPGAAEDRGHAGGGRRCGVVTRRPLPGCHLSESIPLQPRQLRKQIIERFEFTHATMRALLSSSSATAGRALCRLGRPPLRASRACFSSERPSEPENLAPSPVAPENGAGACEVGDACCRMGDGPASAGACTRGQGSVQPRSRACRASLCSPMHTREMLWCIHAAAKAACCGGLSKPIWGIP